MAVWDRMTAAWLKWTGAPTTTTTTVVEATAAPALFQTESGRRAMIRDCRVMVEEDTRPDEIISTLARDAIKGGFSLMVTGARAEEALESANALVERLGLMARLDDWARMTFRDGDAFLEIGATEAGEVVEVTRKPTLEMVRNSNEYDQFTEPEQAFFWSEMPYSWGGGGGEVVFFAEWQIIHARWNHNDGAKYGRPLFGSARKAFKRMSQGELDIAVRRKTRSGMRYSHVLEDASSAEIEAYKVMNRSALDDPFAAVSDFFLNKRGAITAIQGDAHLSEIEDVLHHVDTFGVASPVPLELIGYGRNLNRDVLEQKQEQYVETLGAVQQWLVAEFIQPLIERQWLLEGIWPDGLTLDVIWKSKRQATPTELAEMARFAATVKAAGLLTNATLLRVMATVLPDFDIDAEMEALAATAEDEMSMAMRVAGNALAPAETD